MIRKIPSKVPSFFITLIKLFALEFLVLQVCRVVFFLVFKTTDGSAVPFLTVLKAFRMGFEFDMVASTYALLLPAFLLLLAEVFYGRTMVFHRLALFSTQLIFLIYVFVSTADFPYYGQFNSHLNRQAFLWAASPAFVIRLIFGNVSYYGYLFLFCLFAFIIVQLVKNIYRMHLKRQAVLQHSFTRVFEFTLLLVALLIAGARGRLSSKSTTHEGLAIVSDNLFINQVALNPNFTFFRSLFFQKVKKYQVPANIDESIAFARNYLGVTRPYERSVAREQKADSAFSPYNVVIVCMESMSAYKMGIHGREILTPHLNSLVKESVYFDRFFSSGIHTFNGLFSTCAGYPSMLTDHALRRYTKKPFETLGNLLQKKNYETFFYSTHDPHFDNMSGFFTQNGYAHTYSGFDLPEEKTISVTGVPDHEIYKLFFSTVNNSTSGKPFLAFVMTGSDHGPWAIPTGIPFKPDADTEEKRATQYADWALGEFMRRAKKQPWYNNTLFVFLGDHGYAIGGTYEMPLSYNHVPLLLHMPHVLKPDTNHNLGYQPDVLSTVAGVLNLGFINTTFGVNILKEKHPFVYFTADDKIGVLSDDGYFFYELLTQKTRRLRKYMALDQRDYYSKNRIKADSLEKDARMMLDAAEYFLRQDYFSY